MFPFAPKFEVAFDVDPGTEPGAADWTDLSGDVWSYQIEFGRAAEGGISTVELDDADRNYDQTNPTAPYNLVPMRHARISITVDGTSYPLWRGYVEDWPPRWPGFNDARVQVTLVEPTAWLALQDADLDLPRQRSDLRVAALLDEGGWAAGRRDIAQGRIRVEPYEQVSANLFRVLIDTVDAEDGVLYVDPDGDIVFRSRHHRFDSVAQSTASTYGAGLPVSSVNPTPTPLTNVARIELADGRVFEAVDSASVTAYGPRMNPTRDLPLSPTESEAVGQWEVYRYATPNLALSEVTFLHPTGPEVAEIVQRRVGDLIRFRHQHPGGGDEIDMHGHLESGRIHIENGRWQATWNLSPYFGAGPWLTLDDATLGKMDDDNMLAP